MTGSQAVIDAGIAVFRVMDTPVTPAAIDLWAGFTNDETELHAPKLWQYEVTSVLHRYLYDGLIQADEAEARLRTIFQFGVDLVDGDEPLRFEAFRWATRLHQRAAYDGFYLALAERLGADFWTSDQRLYNNARQIGITWIHLLTRKLAR